MRYSVIVAAPRDQTGGAVRERVRSTRDTPRQYKVVLLNDDYSTMDFVVHILEDVFQKTPAEAYGIMMQVHVNGRGLAGIYPHEIAETKVDTVATMARTAGFPLRAIMEEA
ncbi:MAG: ATP-dependent Clp protease adaptor ClpS [Vicinamibacterales bacterium]